MSAIPGGFRAPAARPVRMAVKLPAKPRRRAWRLSPEVRAYVADGLALACLPAVLGLILFAGHAAGL